jgi:hypothetical protein
MWGLSGPAVLGVALELHVRRAYTSPENVLRFQGRAGRSARWGVLSGPTVRAAAVVSRATADRRLPSSVVHEDPRSSGGEAQSTLPAGSPCCH